MTKTARNQLAANSAANASRLSTYADKLGRAPAVSTEDLLRKLAALRVPAR